MTSTTAQTQSWKASSVTKTRRHQRFDLRGVTTEGRNEHIVDPIPHSHLAQQPPTFRESVHRIPTRNNYTASHSLLDHLDVSRFLLARTFC